ncbi:hypothetical protein Gohar_012577, partial [Gossypium harknessii]|nr:hypothetical protein [Gossypium harknessii]
SGDTGTKRAKVDQESKCKVNEASNFVERSTTDREKHMASSSLETVASTSYVTSVARTEKPDVDLLPNEMHEMRIRDEKTADPDEKDMEAPVIKGNGTETGQIISATIGGRDGKPKQTISYMAERVIGTGSFGVVFQAKCLERGESVAIKKVPQDKRYKNRELQIMRILDHPNVVQLKHCFFSNTDKDELYLNLVLEYVPETVYQVSKHYTKMNYHVPILHVQLYIYQICRALNYLHHVVGVCHRDIKPQNLLAYCLSKAFIVYVYDIMWSLSVKFYRLYHVIVLSSQIKDLVTFAVNPHTHQLKICDFGSAKMLVPGEPNISYICSRYYRAPELIFGATVYSTAIDMWSVGCVMAELLLGH